MPWSAPIFVTDARDSEARSESGASRLPPPTGDTGPSAMVGTRGEGVDSDPRTWVGGSATAESGLLPDPAARRMGSCCFCIQLEYSSLPPLPGPLSRRNKKKITNTHSAAPKMTPMTMPAIWPPSRLSLLLLLSVLAVTGRAEGFGLGLRETAMGAFVTGVLDGDRLGSREGRLVGEVGASDGFTVGRVGPRVGLFVGDVG